MTRSGAAMIAAALLFWVAWALMPGVGVTDAQEIFALVGARRTSVAISVIVQLISAVLYVPALLGLAGDAALWSAPGVRWGAGLLLVGAMGSAADAVLHLLAYAMTAPGLDAAAMDPVMRFMQGPGLVLVAPLIAAFFAGSIGLSIALARAGAVPRWHPWIYALAPLALAAGGARLLAARGAGLAFLAVFSAAQAHAGAALIRRRR